MILRFSPSPTGNLAVGNVFILLNLLILNIKYVKYLIIRIDDTDITNYNIIFIKLIIKKINNLKINYKNLFFQTNKNYYYKEILIFIYNKKKNYLNKNYKFYNFILIYKFINNFIYFKLKKFNYCYYSIKLNLFKYKYKYNKKLFLLKFNNNYSYNYSSIIDDINSNINIIVRGMDHINNYMMQIIILFILNKYIIKIFHNKLILNDKKKKISKKKYIKNINLYFLYIYFFFYYSKFKLIKNYNTNKNKNNIIFDLIKFKKIEISFTKILNLNYFLNNFNKKKKLIFLNLKYFIKFNKFSFKYEYFYINKINFININFFIKFLFKKSLLNKSNVNIIYIYKLFILKLIKLNFIKFKKFNLIYKKFNISYKVFKIWVKNLTYNYK